MLKRMFLILGYGILKHASTLAPSTINRENVWTRWHKIDESSNDSEVFAPKQRHVSEAAILIQL